MDKGHLFDGADICVKCNRCRLPKCTDERCQTWKQGCDDRGGEFDQSFRKRLRALMDEGR